MLKVRMAVCKHFCILHFFAANHQNFLSVWKMMHIIEIWNSLHKCCGWAQAHLQKNGVPLTTLNHFFFCCSSNQTIFNDTIDSQYLNYIISQMETFQPGYFALFRTNCGLTLYRTAILKWFRQKKRMSAWFFDTIRSTRSILDKSFVFLRWKLLLCQKTYR